VVNSLVVEVLGVDDSLDNLLHQLLLEVLSRDLFGVLSRDNDGVDTERLDSTVGELLVFDGNLGLRIRSEPSEFTRSTELSHLVVKLVGKHEGEGHEFLGFCKNWAKSVRSLRCLNQIIRESIPLVA